MYKKRNSRISVHRSDVLTRLQFQAISICNAHLITINYNYLYGGRVRIALPFPETSPHPTKTTVFDPNKRDRESLTCFTKWDLPMEGLQG